MSNPYKVLIFLEPIFYHVLKLYSEFAKWAKKKIINKGFVECVDYSSFEQKVDGKNKGRFSKIDKTVDVGNLKRP